VGGLVGEGRRGGVSSLKKNQADKGISVAAAATTVVPPPVARSFCACVRVCVCVWVCCVRVGYLAHFCFVTQPTRFTFFLCNLSFTFISTQTGSVLTRRKNAFLPPPRRALC
jgi:hypothetical protein